MKTAKTHDFIIFASVKKTFKANFSKTFLAVLRYRIKEGTTKKITQLE